MRWREPVEPDRPDVRVPPELCGSTYVEDWTGVRHPPFEDDAGIAAIVAAYCAKRAAQIAWREANGIDPRERHKYGMRGGPPPRWRSR